MKFYLVFIGLLYGCHAIIYENYNGKPCTKTELKRHEEKNTTASCTIDIKPCDPLEGRRVDGSCNNLNYPSYGAQRTSYKWMLPANFSKNNEPRNAVSGKPLPLPRIVRTKAWTEGHRTNDFLTQLFPAFIVLVAGDFTSQHDSNNFLSVRPYCCLEKGKHDSVCIPNKIPDDDPVFRFYSVRCLNLTKPISYQTLGCLGNDTEFSRVSYATPLYDLDTLYGDSLAVLESHRTPEGGCLKTEVVNGTIWPPSVKTEENLCIQNKKPTETKCYDYPNSGGNSLFGIQFFTIIFWRQHNFIAESLAKVNPCWDNDKLFYTAREINIAIYNQIYRTEALSIMIGKETLVKEGIISEDECFRTVYNSSELPQMTHEYQYLFRWFHTIQESRLEMREPDGTYVGDIPIGNLTYRSGFLSNDKHMEQLTHGLIWQPTGGADYTVDPDIANIALGGMQEAIDLLTSDLTKGRWFGFQPYIEYLKYFYGKNINSFNDLRDFMPRKNIDSLESIYENVRDIDFFVGVSMEYMVPGGMIPKTMCGVIIKHVKTIPISDRFWFEHAFSLEQILEIRKMSIARVLCDNGDSVSHIQPSAFKRIGPDNERVACSQIKKMDFSKWKDPTCDKTT